MIRDVFEKGVASVVARYLLDGSAETLLDRVGKAGVLTPEQLQSLRSDTLANLQKVRDEGAPYADMVMTAVKEATKALPVGPLATTAISAATAVPWRDLATSATRVALDMAARGAEIAAAKAHDAAANMQPKAEAAAAEDAP